MKRKRERKRTEDIKTKYTAQHTPPSAAHNLKTKSHTAKNQIQTVASKLRKLDHVGTSNNH